MINLTAARLIWLLYTSDWVEEGAGSELDLMWRVGSSWAPVVQQLRLRGLLPALSWSLPCCPLPSSGHRPPQKPTSLPATLAICCYVPPLGGFCSQEIHSIAPPHTHTPAFLLDTFWKENHQAVVKSRERRTSA